jgi:hypothetical protein
MCKPLLGPSAQLLPAGVLKKTLHFVVAFQVME